jgi:flagella basal body P-ring formation protein FlgA
MSKVTQAYKLLGYLVGVLFLLSHPAWAEDASNTQVPRETVNQKIVEALLEEGHVLLENPKNSLEVTLAGYYDGFEINHSQNATPVIHDLALEERMQRFSATVEFPGKGETYPIHGRYEEVTEVPVLADHLRSGEVIKAEDLSVKKIAISTIKPRTITEANTLIGKQTARFIAGGKPLAENDIMEPYLVKENHVAQMVYQTPYMQLQVPVKVMQDGSAGDLVKVTNLESGKTVLAKVTGENIVAVEPVVLNHDVRMAYGY